MDFIKVKGVLSVASKPVTYPKNSDVRPTFNSRLEFNGGTLSVFPNGGFLLTFYEGGEKVNKAKIENEHEIFVDRVEITQDEKRKSSETEDNLQEISPKEKDLVVYSYRNLYRYFNGFFSPEERSQFYLLLDLGETKYGNFETLRVKNKVTEKGGTLQIKFRTIFSSTIKSICTIELKLELEQPKKALYS